MTARQVPVLGLLVLGACAQAGPPPGGGGGEPEPDAGPSLPDYDFAAPGIETTSPGEIALGDTLQVFGHDFLPPEFGTMALALAGTFTADDQTTATYSGELALTYRNPAVAELEFGAHLFSPAAGKTGVFRGTARVVSRLTRDVRNANAGDERSSGEATMGLRILPSIDLVEFHSVDDAGCAPVTAATSSGANLSLSVRALGLGEATAAAPIHFRVGFVGATMAVQYVKKDVYEAWPLDFQPGLKDTVYVDAPAGQNTMTFTVRSGDSLVLDPTWKQDELVVQPAISIGSQAQSNVLLGRFAAGAVSGGPGPMRTNVVIEADRGDGLTARRVVSMDVWNQWEILPYDGNQRLLERYPAEVPSGQCGSCVPGGDIGRELSYTEGESTSRSRSISMRWDVSVANSLGAQIMVGPFVPYQIAVNAQTTWSSTFGMDVTEAVSTETHRSVSVTAHILPTFYGLCYRQLSRYERTVDIAYHNGCGASAVVGEAVVTDWGWGFDVASAPECPPRTGLPEAARFE